MKQRSRHQTPGLHPLIPSLVLLSRAWALELECLDANPSFTSLGLSYFICEMSIINRNLQHRVVVRIKYINKHICYIIYNIYKIYK